MDILKEIWEDYKKIILIILGAIFALIIVLIVFSIIIDPVKISFTGDDATTIATMSDQIKLGAVAKNKANDQFELNWQVSAGNLSTTKGSEVVWQLPSEDGTYTISVSAGNKVKNKTVTVISNKLEEMSLKDNSNISYIDSDSDGLSDSYENNSSKTDSNNKDSDGDTLSDGSEVALGLNANEKESKDDGVQDDERNLKYNLKYESIGAELLITGTDNITDTTIDRYNLNTINEISSVISQVYSVSMQGNVNSAKLTLKYDKGTVTQKGLNEGKLAIYKLDIDNNKYIKQDSSVNSQSCTVSANITDSGKFFIADSTKMKEQLSTELMFVIDNSGSMYPSEMVEGSQENDTQFKRVDLSNRIIDKLKGDYKFGAGKFTYDYEELCPLTNDKDKVKEKINSIKSLTEKFTGTYIGNALEQGLNQFKDSKDNARKYMILLTDGKDTTGVDGYDENKFDTAINEACSKNVKVFTIGLGNELDTEKLESISKKTGGKFYYASNSNVLEDIFELISADINYGFIDMNKDSNDDYIIYKDNKFLSKKNGMPINNFSSKGNVTGQTYGMSLISKLYYENKLPNSMSSISVKNSVTGENEYANGYNLQDDEKNNFFVLSNYELKNLQFMKNTTNDFMSSSIEKGVLYISKDYRDNLKKYGFVFDYYDSPSSNSGFKEYEVYGFDKDMLKNDNEEDNEEDNDEESASSELEDSDQQFLNAIYRLDILKYRDDKLSLENNPDKTFDYIVKCMDNNEVPLLLLNDNYAVCLQKILIDINNDNHIKLEVYDSNHGSTPQYIEVERTRIYNELDGNNKNKFQYKCKYNNKNVSVSVSIPNIDMNL